MAARTLNAQYLMDIESRMQLLQEQEYNRLTQHLWCDKVTKVRQSTGKRDVFTWLLSTAMIRDTGGGGNVRFDDLVSQFQEIESSHAGAGLKLNRDQLEDSDGGGVELASTWASDIGAYMGYWKQKQTTRVLKEGHTSAFTAYTGLPLFSAAHPVNPFKASAGTFNNIFTSTGSGVYPGACPIDDSVTVDAALVNLAKISSYIASIKMPNGEDPRFLRPSAIICSPRLMPRAIQLTSAKFIAQAATGGAATADVENLIKTLGYATPTQADELAGFEDDKTFFVVAEQVSTSQLGAIVYTERKPFQVNYFSGSMSGGELDAYLSRVNEIEYHVDGRNTISAGHPHLIFKCKGS